MLSYSRFSKVKLYSQKRSGDQPNKQTNYFYYVPDIDECSGESSVCDENAACTNNEGSYSCTCNQGFIADGTTCKGILCFSSGNIPRISSDDTNRL